MELVIILSDQSDATESHIIISVQEVASAHLKVNVAHLQPVELPVWIHPPHYRGRWECALDITRAMC